LMSTGPDDEAVQWVQRGRHDDGRRERTRDGVEENAYRNIETPLEENETIAARDEGAQGEPGGDAVQPEGAEGHGQDHGRQAPYGGEPENGRWSIDHLQDLDREIDQRRAGAVQAEGGQRGSRGAPLLPEDHDRDRSSEWQEQEADRHHHRGNDAKRTLDRL